MRFQFLRGQEWYNLEASRAVNQAIGRVIRHKDDYGAILLLDNRFNGLSLKSQMSLWIRNHIKVVKNFGELLRELKLFFNAADVKVSFFNHVYNDITLNINTKLYFQFKPATRFDYSLQNSTLETASSSENLFPTGDVTIHKRNKPELQNGSKKIKLTVVPNSKQPAIVPLSSSTSTEYIIMVLITLMIYCIFYGFY